MGMKFHFFKVSVRLALILFLAGLALSQGTGAQALAGSADTFSVDIERGFQPASIQINQGTAVEWQNKDHSLHTVTSDSGAFDSGAISKDGKYLHTFSVAGTYTYKDKYSTSVGTVVVLGSSSTPPSVIVSPPPTTTPTPNPIAAPSTLSIGDNFFQPASLSTLAGTAVTWRNSGGSPHSVTSNTGLFDSGMVNPGQSFSFTFQTPGTYAYHCIFHGGQSGTITVTGNGGTANPTTPSSPAVTPPPPVTNPAPPAVSQPGSLNIGDNFFTPASFSVAAGATVTWVNHGQSPHSVTSNAGLFDSGMVSPGQSFSFAFQSPGTYAYHCIFHSGQTGTITVTGSGGATNPTSPAVTPPPVTNAAPPAVTQPGSLNIGDNYFIPASFSIMAGATVTWVNRGQIPHTVTSDTGLFDSGMLSPGRSFAFSFAAPGTYAYHCLFHQGQTGTIVVSANGNSVATVTASAQAASQPTSTKLAAESITTPQQDDLKVMKTIQVGDNIFTPAEMALDGGTTITWTNGGKFPHTVTSDTGLFDSGMIKPGQSFSFSFETPGTYAYHCLYHASQAGTVVVTISKNSLAPLSSMASNSQTITVTEATGRQESPTAGQQAMPVAKEHRLSLLDGFDTPLFAALIVLELSIGSLMFFLRPKRNGRS